MAPVATDPLDVAASSMRLLPQHLGMLRRLCVGSGKRGALIQLEVAGGDLEGAVLILEQGQGRSVRLEVQLPPQLPARAALDLKERLTLQGVDLESFEVG